MVKIGGAQHDLYSEGFCSRPARGLRRGTVNIDIEARVSRILSQKVASVYWYSSLCLQHGKKRKHLITRINPRLLVVCYESTF